jgi:hypothetical protein
MGSRSVVPGEGYSVRSSESNANAKLVLTWKKRVEIYISVPKSEHLLDGLADIDTAVEFACYEMNLGRREVKI